MIKLYKITGELVSEFNTQKEVAEYLGKSKASVSKAINGKLKTLEGYVVTTQDFKTHCKEYNIPITVKCYVISRDSEIINYAFSLVPIGKHFGILYVRLIDAMVNKVNIQGLNIEYRTANIDDFSKVL